MQIRFKISCCSCGCCFELDSETFKAEEALSCPNCKQPFPEKEFSQLQQTMSGIRSISEVCAVSSKEKGFQISLVFAENASGKNLPF